ncbi:MAG: hypothetical protein V2G42_07775 [bacterium JZ-2024 1]
MSEFILTIPSGPSGSAVQPLNRQPGEGVGVSVTTVALPWIFVQSPGREMPAGLRLTSPSPFTATVTRKLAAPLPHLLHPTFKSRRINPVETNRAFLFIVFG